MQKEIRFIKRIDDIVKTDPNKTALVYNDGENKLSYKELDNLSSFVASKLINQGIKPGDRIVVMMERNHFSIAMEIGVLKAGAVFIPVVPSYPKERIDYIYKDSSAKLLIDKTFFDGYELFINKFDIVEPNFNMVSIIYTSGSTGYPKGVVYDLDAYNATTERLKEFYEGLEDINFASFAPMGFVAHLLEYAAIFNLGGTIHILSDALRVDVYKLRDYYLNNKISACFVSPTLFKLIDKRLPDLKRVIFAGEKVTDFNPDGYDIRLGYGQTEALHLAMYKIDSPKKEAFVGKASPNTEILILDENGNDVGYMKEGEICAIGVFPKQYLNLKEASEKTFKILDNGKVLVHTGDIGKRHPDQTIEYINRKDFMIKINGSKVDPSEIERVVKSIDNISNCIVKPFEKDNGHVYLCAFYTANQDINNSEIKSNLESKLPHYMIPSYFVHLDKMPLNSNGKIDRSQLLAPSESNINDNYVAPTTELEKKVCNIISKMLMVNQVGVNDNFFSLGGDSLQVAQLTCELAKENLGIIEATQVYENPVISDLVKCILNCNLVGNADYTVVKKGKSNTLPLVLFHTANMGITQSYNKLIKSSLKALPLKD